MPDFFIYSPFQGTSQGQFCYCGGTCSPPGEDCIHRVGNSNCVSCGCHEHKAGIVDLCCPVDIFGSANTAVYCYPGGNIRSIRTTQINAFCRTPPPTDFAWVNHGVKVELFCGLNATGTLVGTIFYGHLNEPRIANGIYNWPTSPLRIMGYLGPGNCSCQNFQCAQGCGAGCCCDTAPEPDLCYCCCYSGIHCHLARSSGNGGYTYPRSCGTSVYLGITPIYRWTVASPQGGC